MKTSRFASLCICCLKKKEKKTSSLIKNVFLLSCLTCCFDIHVDKKWVYLDSSNSFKETSWDNALNKNNKHQTYYLSHYVQNIN